MVSARPAISNGTTSRENRIVASAATLIGAAGEIFQPADTNAIANSAKNAAAVTNASHLIVRPVGWPPSGLAPVNMSANSTSTVIAPP